MRRRWQPEAGAFSCEKASPHVAGMSRGRAITTEIVAASDFEVPFYFAEDYHQQYLAKPGARPYCSAQPLQALRTCRSNLLRINGIS